MQHIGEDTVRCVAMDNTDGLQRNLEVEPTGQPITMPAGEQIKGRMMNVIGKPIDGMSELDMKGCIQYTVSRLNLKSCLHTRKCLQLVLKSLICWNLI